MASLPINVLQIQIGNKSRNCTEASRARFSERGQTVKVRINDTGEMSAATVTWLVRKNLNKLSEEGYLLTACNFSIDRNCDRQLTP